MLAFDVRFRSEGKDIGLVYVSIVDLDVVDELMENYIIRNSPSQKSMVNFV